MPKVLEYRGSTYEVPDNFTDEQLVELVENETPRMPPAVQAEGLEKVFPVVGTEQQKQRDAVAAELRGKEIENDPKKIKQTITNISEALGKRPMNADVRKMLKRELSHWKTLQEQQGGN